MSGAPFDRRLVVVLGKGGVGRSTVAAALALAAGREGLRVALVEVNGARSLADAFGEAPRQLPRPVAPGVELLSLSAAGCLEEYVADRLRMAPLTHALFRAKVMQALIDGIPGMSDLLHHGKIHRLTDPPDERRYDLVVVDAPATGHGLQFLATPSAMCEMTRRGPLYDEARLIADRLADPAWTAAILVTLPEALPVSESLELLDQLGPGRAVVQRVVVDQVDPDALPPEVPWTRLRAALTGPLVEVGDRLERHLERQRQAVERLRAGLGAVPVTTLPRLAIPLTPSGYDALATALLDQGVGR